MCPSFMLDLVKASKKTHLLTFVQSRLRSKLRSKSKMQLKATTKLKSKATTKVKSKNALDDLIMNLVNLRYNKSINDPNDVNKIRQISDSLLNQSNPNY